LTNSDIAELLALEADKQSEFLAKALRKASRVAFTWPEEVTALLAQGRSLTELPSIGPHLARVITGWIADPPPIPARPDIRRNFMTMAEARQLLGTTPHPGPFPPPLSGYLTPALSPERRGSGRGGEGAERAATESQTKAPGGQPLLAKGRRSSKTRPSVPEFNPTLAKRYKGDLQMHTVWSDGSASIMEMADAAIERGYQYIGITDHSKGLKIARGIDEQTLRRQAKEIAQANEKLAQKGVKFRVLRSIEMNLNPRGEGDMDPAALAELDVVVGSFHSALRTKEDQTDRYLAALRNPTVDILGHPRGRIYNYRLGLSADWPRVFATAAELDKAVEMDSYADRQDLDVDLLALAREAGVKIAIDTDAHHPEQLDFAALGLAAAMRANIPPERIINFMPTDELLQWVKARREEAPPYRGKILKEDLLHFSGEP
jgi:histidinol phosphatase-like PHP family hydrolase